MPDEVTEAMVEAALAAWIGKDFPNWRSMGETWNEALRKRMRNALIAAINAAPSAHGERG